MGWCALDLAQDSYQWRVLLKIIMNLWVPYIAMKFLSIYTTGSFTRRAQMFNLHKVTFKCITLGKEV
jgi:hypothetical protein